MLAAIYCMFDKKPLLMGVMLGFGCAAKITMLPIALILIVMSGRDCLKVLLWTVIVASPWYLVNSVQYGNPIYPFFDAYFQWIPWGLQDAITDGVGRMPHAINYFPIDANPWEATMHSNNPVAMVGEPSSIGPFVLCLTPLLVFAKWSNKAIELLLLGCILWAYWLWGEQMLHARYMMPLWTLHIFLGAWALTNIMRWSDD